MTKNVLYLLALAVSTKLAHRPVDKMEWFKG